MSKDITIFISSRFNEFRELRDKIIKERFSKLDVGLKLNMLDDRDGIADARSPAVMSIEEASDADIFILLMGETYKEVQDGEKSYTHQEYDTAIEKGLHILAFPIGDCYDDANRKLSTDDKLFREFQDAILINNKHTTAPFSPSDYDVDEVYETIYKTLKEYINLLINKGLIAYKNTNKISPELFKSYYQNHFKTISLLIEDEKKPIDDIYVNLAIIREEKEEDIKDKSKLLDRDKIINSYEEIYKPKEPIAIEELIEKSSKSNSAKALIYGKAGIGKTTFCKYIAFRWAKGELYSEFENIVYIALREWKEGGLESVIKKIYFEEKHKDSAIEIEQLKTLFLFDGYDELSDTSVLHNAIKKYNLQNYIITSRPYGYRKSDFDVNEMFETIGFTDENVTAYIEKFFTDQNHKTNLQNFLKQNINIKHIAYIPLMLEMICSLWREKAKGNQSFLSPMTMTELYSEVIEYIFFEYTETNNTAYIQEREEEIFDYLGKIAFEGLKSQVIVLDKSIIKEKKEFFVDFVLKTGFLKSDRKRRNPLMNNYEFPHLTFQEYFSALYVSKLPTDEISEIIRDYKFYPYMQVFFAFLGGLIEDKEFLLREIESEPKDEIGHYVLLLTLNCINEIEKKDIKNFEIIKKNVREWLLIVFKKKQNYNFLQKKLQTVYHLMNDDFIRIFLYTIEKESRDAHRGIELIAIKLFINFDINNENLIDIMISRIKDNQLELELRKEIAKRLAKLTSQNDIIFKKINLEKNFPQEFIENSSIKSFFYAFNKKDINLGMIVKNTLYNALPLYLKNNKLCTIYENQEIQTQREITLEEIERVKRELGLPILDNPHQNPL